MINCIIFSKDRALQLDALISSIHQNCPLFKEIIVVYNYSSQEFKDGYDRFAERNDNKVFLKNEQNFSELTFGDLVKKTLKECDSQYICLMSDDSIFYKKVDFTQEDVHNYLSNNQEACCISMRCGLNITEQTVGTIPYKPRIVDYCDDGVFISWDRTRYPPWTVLNYPLSLDGNIFRKSDLVPLVDCVDFSGPNDMEIKLLSQAYKMPNTVLSGKNSYCVNISYNRVQSEVLNILGQYELDAKDLNDMYLNNLLLDWQHMNFANVCCEHQSFEPKFCVLTNGGYVDIVWGNIK